MKVSVDTISLVIVSLTLLLMICSLWKKSINDQFVNTNMYNGNKKFTAIIQNHNRPDMAQELINNLQQYSHIDEILLLESIYENFLEYIPVNTKAFDCVESNKKYGVKQRFVYAKYAKNENLLYIDDDMLPSFETVSVLLKKVIQEPDIIHGIYGRSENYKNTRLDDIFTDLYLQPTEKKVDIVLTKILATTKSNVQLFMDNCYLVEDVVSNAPGVKWNGEDIFLNMIVKHNNKGKLNKTYCLEHSFKNSQGISSSKNHFNYRKKFIKIIKNRLNNKAS